MGDFNRSIGLLQKFDNARLSFLLILLEKYFAGALLQYERIQVAKAKLNVPRLQLGVDSSVMNQLFLDIHFYFICWDKVQNLFESVVKESRDPGLEQLWGKYKGTFKFYNDARNHLEHIQERALSQKNYLRDFGNLYGDYYTFGGEKYPVGEASAQQLLEIYNAIFSYIEGKP